MTAKTNTERSRLHAKKQKTLRRTRSSLSCNEEEHKETKALVSSMRDNKDYKWEAKK